MREDLYKPGCIRTYTGKYVDVSNFKEEDVCIEDIAHALSHMPRFGGHTKQFYSVAQHSLLCCRFAPQGYKLEALLHDACEAYLLDMPTPIKEKLSDYQNIENHVHDVIFKKFGFPFLLSDEVMQADKKALEFEWVNAVLEDRLPSLPPLQVEVQFLTAFKIYEDNRNL